MIDRPRKPWYRPRNVVLATLLVGCCWITYAVIWALTAEPMIATDYGNELEMLTARNQPAGENAWPHLVETARIVNELETESGGWTFGRDSPPAELDRAHQAIAELRRRGAFGHLDAAMQCPNAVRPQPSGELWLFFASFPEVGHLRSLARAQLISIHSALEAGDTEKALTTIDQLLFVGRAISFQPTIVEYLTGQSIVMLAIDEMGDHVLRGSVEASTAADFFDRLDVEPVLGHISVALDGERLLIHDVVQRTYSDNGRGNGRLLLEKIGGIGFSATSQPVSGSMPSVANLAGFYFAGRRQMIEETDALFDEMIRQSRIPFHARQDQRIDLDAWVEDLGPRYFLLGMLVPALNLAIDSSDRMQCRINGTRLMLAIEGYRAMHHCGQCR